MTKPNPFAPSTAITRKLPQSFAHCIKMEQPQDPIDVTRAHLQHELYTKLLISLVPTIFELPSDEAYPDCSFVEDTALVIGNKAVITRIGALQRRGEEKLVQEALIHAGINDFFNIKAPATLDGGDVLFTGRHIFVGLSTRTNEEGFNQLRAIFSDLFPVYGVPVQGALHLKSLMSAVDHETLVIADTGRPMVEFLYSDVFKTKGYRLIFVPDPVAANVLSIGSTLVIQEGFPKSERILCELAEEKKREIVKLTMSELIKADSALTCSSILF